MINKFWNFSSDYEDNLCLHDTNKNILFSYTELEAEIKEVIKSVESNSKKLAILFCENSVDSIIYYLALLRCGHSVLILNSIINAEIKSFYIERYLPELFFSSQLFSHEDYKQHKINSNLSVFIRKEPESIVINSELALLLPTSGTTGYPKLARISYNNIQSNAESISQYLQITQSERAITSLPMSYTYGLSVINSHLLKGASLILTNQSALFRDFWKLFNLYQCTSFAGVPFTYQSLKKNNFNKKELPTLRYMTQAGGRLSEELIKYFLDYSLNNDKRFYVMYGQTEATPRISYVPFEFLKNKVGSIGIAIPNGTIKIFNEDKEITEEGKIGEIVYYGPNVMMGYAEHKNDLQKGDELSGELRTGDIGFKDKDNFFFITGRMKRFLKIFGLRINLDEIEKLLQNEFQIPVACVGKDDFLQVAIQSDNHSLILKTKKKVSQHYKIKPSCIETFLLEIFPTNTAGKYDYKKIQEIVNHK